MGDAGDSKSPGPCARAGSNPASGTNIFNGLVVLDHFGTGRKRADLYLVSAQQNWESDARTLSIPSDPNDRSSGIG